jgi:hypothetical protein
MFSSQFTIKTPYAINFKSLGVNAFMQRIGGALDLNTTPSFHFRYSRYNVEDDMTEDDINDWEIYPIADQLSLLAKLVLSYQHCETEPSFSIMLKGNHLVAIGCTGHHRADGSKFYRFSLTLHIVTTYIRVYTHTPHVLQFVVSPGVQNPFAGCEFVWAPPIVV